MEKGELDSILDYVLNSQLGNIKTKNEKQYKKVIINDTEYSYNKKPITGKSKTKLEQISKTLEFKRFDVLKRATKGIAVRKALKNYAIKQKANITEEKSEYKSYANSYSISYIKMKGYKGLSY